MIFDTQTTNILIAVVLMLIVLVVGDTVTRIKK